MPGSRRVRQEQEYEQEQEMPILLLLLPFTQKERPTFCHFTGPLTLTLSQGEREQHGTPG